MVGREGLENRRIVWITSQGSVRPHSSDGNRKPRDSIRAVLRANEGEGGHMGRGRVTEEEFVEQGGGWEFSCSRTAKQGRRREKLKRPKSRLGTTLTWLCSKDPRAHREQKSWMLGGRTEGLQGWWEGRGEHKLSPP